VNLEHEIKHLTITILAGTVKRLRKLIYIKQTTTTEPTKLLRSKELRNHSKLRPTVTLGKLLTKWDTQVSSLCVER